MGDFSKEDPLFDISDLSLPSHKERPAHAWMCVGCQRVSANLCRCAACGSKDQVPYLDRRPLLLNKETQNGIIGLIDRAAEQVPQAEIDEQLYLTGEYMPFLSSLIDSSQLAEQRRLATNAGFRTTTLSTDALLALFAQMELPSS